VRCYIGGSEESSEANDWIGPPSPPDQLRERATLGEYGDRGKLGPVSPPPKVRSTSTALSRLDEPQTADRR